MIALSAAGMMMLISAADLIALYLGLDAYPAVVAMFPTVAMFATACTIEDDPSASSTLL